MFIFTITSHITIVWLLSVIFLSTSPHLSPLHLLFSSLAPSIPKPSLYYSPYLTLKIDATQLRPFLPSSSLLAEQFLERLTSNHKLLQLVQSFLLSQAQYPLTLISIKWEKVFSIYFNFRCKCCLWPAEHSCQYLPSLITIVINSFDIFIYYIVCRE